MNGLVKFIKDHGISKKDVVYQWLRQFDGVTVWVIQKEELTSLMSQFWEKMNYKLSTQELAGVLTLELDHKDFIENKGKIELWMMALSLLLLLRLYLYFWVDYSDESEYTRKIIWTLFWLNIVWLDQLFCKKYLSPQNRVDLPIGDSNKNEKLDPLMNLMRSFVENEGATIHLW